MVKHRISGLPVLDKQGRPVGVVSEFDLLELICEGKTERDKVCHYMSTDLVGVTVHDTWVTIVDLFRAKRVRRLPVLRDGQVVGIVTRHDLMRAIRNARRQLRRKLPGHICELPGDVGKDAALAATGPVAAAEAASPAANHRLVQVDA
jgi:CBS-domain-containing membrane protein